MAAMTPADALAVALRDGIGTPDEYMHEAAADAIAAMPPGSAVVTIESLAAALESIGPWWRYEPRPLVAAIIEAHMDV